jgi:serine phosphatase RsbU (regulator of sigma subunit)
VRIHAGEPRAVGTPSLLLGVDPDARFAEETVALDDGDSLVLYTDGVLDAQGPHERFGEDRLLDALRGSGTCAEDTLRQVAAPLESFQRGPQRDDIALLVIRRAAEVGAGVGARHARTGVFDRP